jgi:hypothetical protein
MTALLLFGIGIPAIVFGVPAHNGGEVVLGLIAIGMALVGWAVSVVRYLFAFRARASAQADVVPTLRIRAAGTRQDVRNGLAVVEQLRERAR